MYRHDHQAAGVQQVERADEQADGGRRERAGSLDPAVDGEQPGDDQRRHHRVDHRDAGVEGGGRHCRRHHGREQGVRAGQAEHPPAEQVRQRQQRRVDHRVDQLDQPIAVGEVPVAEEGRRDQHRVADPPQQVVLAAEPAGPAHQRAGGVQVAVLVGVRDGQHDVPGQPHPPGDAEHPAGDEQQRHQPSPRGCRWRCPGRGRRPLDHVAAGCHQRLLKCRSGPVPRPSVGTSDRPVALGDDPLAPRWRGCRVNAGTEATRG